MASLLATSARLDSSVPDLNRLRAKYAPNVNASSAGRVGGGDAGGTPAATTRAHAAATAAGGTTKADGTEYTQAELAAFHRLDRVKICPACGGQGTQRKHFNHYYVDVDCDDCSGDGYVQRADPATLVARAQACKAKAVQLFKAGEFARADAEFNQGLAQVAQFAATGTPAAAMRASLIANRAACALRLGQWDMCVEHCDRMLTQDGENVKALWRKSQALLGKSGELGGEARKEEKGEGNKVDGGAGGGVVGSGTAADAARAVRAEARVLLQKMLQVEPNHSKALAALEALPLEV
jgi:tetratricopeptide (TPR) repeat protein